MNIEGSGALVAGGASGLGEATARRLHERGAVVTIADVNAEKGQALADELGVRFVSCDVREEDQVRAAVALVAGSPAIEFAQIEAEGFASRAKAALEPLPSGDARAQLERLADYAVRRRA